MSINVHGATRSTKAKMLIVFWLTHRHASSATACRINEGQPLRIDNGFTLGDNTVRVPLMHPMICGTRNFCWNRRAVAQASSTIGEFMRLFPQVYTKSFQKQYNHFFTTYFCTTSWFSTMWHSAQLASLHKTTAVLICTGTGTRSVTSWGLKTPSTSLQFFEWPVGSFGNCPSILCLKTL